MVIEISLANIMKFDGSGNFILWQMRVKDVLGVVGFGEGFEWKITRRNECYGLEGFENEGYIDYQDMLGQ